MAIAGYSYDHELDVLGARPVALGVLDLVFSTPEWVHRRIEQVDFLTATHLHKRTTLDLTVPQPCPATVTWFDGRPVTLLPIDILGKTPMTGFDLRDEEDRPVPILTRRQNGHLAWRGMVAYAEEVLTHAGGLALPSWADPGLRVVTQAEPARALRTIGAFQRMATRHGPTGILFDDEGFNASAHMLAHNFLLVAALPATPGSRRIVKFGYETMRQLPERDKRPRHQRLLESMGWDPTTVEVPVPGFSDCESYHFEAVAPEGIEFVDIVLGDEARVGAQGGYDPKWALGYTDYTAAAPPRAHLSTSRTSDSAAQQDLFIEPTVSLRLRVERTGWLRSSAFASMLVALFLAGGYRYVSDLPHPTRTLNTDPAALAVGLLGIVSLAIVRPGEHAYTAQLLRPVRYVAVGSAVLPIGAAWLLVFPGRGTMLTWFQHAATCSRRTTTRRACTASRARCAASGGWSTRAPTAWTS